MKERRMGRSPCCNKQGLKKGPWTPDEDKILVDFIHSHGHGSWRSLPNLAGLQRCGKSCRLRWTNYLRPDIKRGPFTSEEKKSILQLHAIVGNKWSTIAAQIPGRTDNEIKNYWNTHLKKQLLRMGLDPDTYAPATSGGCAAATRHMAQWESARLEAEARLSRADSVLPPVSGVAGQQQYREGLSDMKSEAPDVFLRLWNSDIGEAFRKVGEELSMEGSCSKQMSRASNSGRREEVESIRCQLEGGSAVTADAATADSSSSNVGMQEEEEEEVETYKLYFDFGGEEMSLLHGCLGGYTYSLFASDLDEASLDTAFE